MTSWDQQPDHHDRHDSIMMSIGMAAVVGCFVIETGMNALFGWNMSGLGLALGFAGIAVFGALCGVLYRREGGIAYILAAVVCFLVSQVAGNAVSYTAFADGGIARQGKASKGATARDELKRLREELKTLGPQRPVATIEPETRLECSRTSTQYRDGAGPRCTALRAELGKAERAAALPALIADALAKSQKAPALAEGEPYLEQLQWAFAPVVGELPLDGLRRGFIIAFVFVLGLIANFGPAMLLGSGGGGGRGRRAASAAATTPPASAGFMPPHALFAPVKQLPAPPRFARLVSDPAAAVGPSESDADLAAGGGAGGTAHAPSSASAPVNITINGAPAVQQQEAFARTAAVVPGEPPARSPRHDVGQQPDAPPVDRSSVNVLTDRLLAFSAACIVAIRGAHVPSDDLYRRYVAWCGSGALGSEAFHALFGDVAGVARHEIAGQLHYQDVALRAPHIRAVA